MYPEVSILIITHDRRDITEECVTRIIYNADKIPHEVLVWDNNSNDGTYDWLVNFQKIFKQITFIHSSSTNYGVEATNFLARKAKGKYLIKIDDDIIPPPDFARQLVQAYEEVKEPKLAFLSWDMPWRDTTFAYRSGKKLYKEPHGKTYYLSGPNVVLVNYNPAKWLVNGACRLCPRDIFFKVGGHPRGIKYGVDAMVSKAAAQKGYYIGYLHAPQLLQHCGGVDTPAMRKFKNAELKRYGNPLHV